MMNQKIAHYKLTAKLGQGGMGEVYRATDTMLEREVAIKVLPKSFATDSARLARFEREAKMLAALNHPNIAVIYGIEESVETHALIMELVEGETLGERLQREPMTVPEALDCCRQIAEALEAAHEKGIIHRDLKPENVKIDEEGKVKVLDFGLAKALADPSLLIDEGINQADSPTLTNLTTVPGQLLGTAPYMSPEQARSRPVDKRSDIWSFGCVLYECLTGKPMFSGEDVTETLASIIKGEPDWSLLPVETPPTIHLLLRKCLNKDRKRRLQHIGDARVDLEQALTDPNGAIIPYSCPALRQMTDRPNRRNHRFVITSSVAAACIITAIFVWMLKPVPPPYPAAPAVHAEVILPGGPLGFLTISPDGNKLAFDILRSDDPITIRHLDRSDFTEIKDTKNSWIMSFSPDGKSIGYISDYTSTNKIWRVAFDGSDPLPIAEFKGGNQVPGFSWSDKGDIVFPDGWNSGLMIVRSVGGNPVPLTSLKEGENSHRWPQCLPGGKYVLFMVDLSDPNSSGQSHRKVAIADLADGSHRILPLKDDCVYARYAESGHLLYVSESVLFAVPFDLKNMVITGSRKDVINGIATTSFGLAHYDISRNGTLVYKAGEAGQEETGTLKWLGFDGTEEVIGKVKGKVLGLDLSPDEKYVAVGLESADGESDVWIVDTKRGIPLRFTDNKASDGFPIWSPNGVWVYFMSDRRDGRPGLWRKRADSPESEAEWVMDHEGIVFYPGSISRDGRHLTYSLQNPTWDLWTACLDEEDAAKRPLKITSAEEGWNAVSPDGKWLAYSSTITGNTELYLASFDDPDKQIRRITVGGGGQTKWSSTGDALYFLGGRGLPGESFWLVEVSIVDDVIETSEPKETVKLTDQVYGWDVDSNGKRFLILTGGDTENAVDDGADPGHTVVRIVPNFFTELNEKVPPAGAN